MMVDESNSVGAEEKVPAWQPPSLPEIKLDAATAPNPFLPSDQSLLPSQMTGYEFDQHYPVPDEFIRTPSGSSVVEPDSVMEHNGRSYHGYKQGKYFLPNDAAEQDRLDMQHALVNIMLDGRLAMAPMKKTPKYVMDVATGTGIWALDFAQQNPTSYVIGTDLSKIQPESELSNIEFLKEDSEEEWIYPQVPKFDYIHLRFVYTCFQDPKKVFQHALDSLSPGGWIEYQDSSPMVTSQDGSHEGTIMQKFSNIFEEGLAAKGRDSRVVTQYKNWMVEAGLEEVVEMTFLVPGSPWPDNPKMKRAGQYMYMDLFEMVRGAAWHVFRGIGYSEAEIEELVLKFKKDSRDPKYKLCYKFVVVYGRKPLGVSAKKTEST